MNFSAPHSGLALCCTSSQQKSGFNGLDREQPTGWRLEIEHKAFVGVPIRRQLMNMNRVMQITYFLLRVVAGFLFSQAGGLILFGWFGGMPGQSSPPPLRSQTGIGGVLEFFGGIAIMLGLLTR